VHKSRHGASSSQEEYREREKDWEEREDRIVVVNLLPGARIPRKEQTPNYLAYKLYICTHTHTRARARAHTHTHKCISHIREGVFYSLSPSFSGIFPVI